MLNTMQQAINGGQWANQASPYQGIVQRAGGSIREEAGKADSPEDELKRAQRAADQAARMRRAAALEAAIAMELGDAGKTIEAAKLVEAYIWPTAGD